MNWQKIDTAPKDGTPILVHYSYLKRTEIVEDFANTMFWEPPTHWMPLPEPPKEG